MGPGAGRATAARGRGRVQPAGPDGEGAPRGATFKSPIGRADLERVGRVEGCQIDTSTRGNLRLLPDRTARGDAKNAGDPATLASLAPEGGEGEVRGTMGTKKRSQPSPGWQFRPWPTRDASATGGSRGDVKALAT